MEWLNFDFSLDDFIGNYIVVGNMIFVIEVWDFDIVDFLELVFIFGSKFLKKKKKKGKKSFLVEGYIDVVFDFLWNKLIRNVLVSVLVDNIVILWDMFLGKLVVSFVVYIDKV